MGTEAVWVPLVMAAVGTAASVYNTRQTAKKQDQALAAQIESGSKKSKEADDRTRQLVDKLGQSSPDAERNTALSQYVKALSSGGNAATAGLGAEKGAVSSRFAQDAKDAALGVTDYGQTQAGLFSTIDAAKRMRQNEGVDIGRALTDINGISRQARAADFLLGLKTNSIARNPWIDAGSSLLTSYAGTMGAGTGRSAPAALPSGASSYGGTGLNGYGSLFYNPSMGGGPR